MSKLVSNLKLKTNLKLIIKIVVINVREQFRL